MSVPRSHPGDHLYLLYQNPLHLWPLIAAFFQEGLERGEQCLYVVEEHPPEAVLTALEAHGLPATKHHQGGGLLLQPADQSALAARPFSVEQAVEGWQSATQQALAAGFRGLRLAVDMSWVLGGPSSLAQLAEYEARADRCFAAHNIRAVCQYNQRRFPEEILLDTLRVHPRLALEGVVRENIYYLPADLFLRQDRRAQFYWYLGRLGQGQAGAPPPPLEALSGPAGKTSPWKAAKVQAGGHRRSPVETASRNWRWQVYCLGELRVHRHDGTPVNWSAAKGATRKVKTLFAYLLERGKAGATMEHLADLLWPDESDTGKALGRLYHTVHALRLALEPDLTKGPASRYLTIREGQCFLALPDETWLDVTAFEQFCYRGERLLEASDDENALACYLAADHLYAGDLLADIPVAYAERIDDDWCWSRRYWLQEMYLKLLVGMAGIYRRRGAAQEGLGYARRALALDPCNEAAHRELMRIFHQTGRPDALDRQYHLCREVLSRHENRPPDPETRHLYRELTQKAKNKPENQR
ncbi:MAG: MEDS domain-containing protein [Anaerolineae bacterium]